MCKGQVRVRCVFFEYGCASRGSAYSLSMGVPSKGSASSLSIVCEQGQCVFIYFSCESECGNCAHLYVCQRELFMFLQCMLVSAFGLRMLSFVVLLRGAACSSIF